jgi:hypothetical protein
LAIGDKFERFMVERLFRDSPAHLALKILYLAEFFYWMKSINVRI